ncbi:unnamed protein product [Brassica napus]|uniref:(rape) hypothetical protein n=1 Tax=Brassica napus TaxID=3708 RepID=A0A816KF77_BRANA|nr:unnamed protein product [Brassica napus]
MGLLFRSDVFDLLGWEDENDSGRFCFEFKPERLTLKSYALSIHNYGPIHTDYDTNTNTKLSIRVSAPEIQQQLKLLLGFLFPEAQNVIDTKASYGSPWRIHEGLTRKLPVTNKYVKPICIGFGEAEDHDLENLKKQLEDDDLIRGTITAEHQGSEAGTHMNPAPVFRIKKQSSFASKACVRVSSVLSLAFLCSIHTSIGLPQQRLIHIITCSAINLFFYL